MPARAQSTITRTTWTDDDGSGTTGTIINNAELQKIYAAIDQLFAGAGSYATFTFGGKLAVLSTNAQALDIAGGAQFGSGNVNLIDSTGKITAISSTYFADLSGANLTALNGSNVSSGTVAIARGGTATGSTPSNGQLLIGNGTGYTVATLTAGAGVGVTNGSGSITVASTRTITSITTTYTALTSDDVILATSGTFTVTLFTAAGNTGKTLDIKNGGAGTVTVDGSSTETIDGELTFTLAANDSLTIVSDGTNWRVL